MGEAMRRPASGPHRHARGDIDCPGHRPRRCLSGLALVGHGDLGRNVAEIDHDARIVGQIIALRTLLALRLPEGAHRAIELPPIDGLKHRNPFGVPGHFRPEAHACISMTSLGADPSDRNATPIGQRQVVPIPSDLTRKYMIWNIMYQVGRDRALQPDTVGGRPTNHRHQDLPGSCRGQIDDRTGRVGLHLTLPLAAYQTGLWIWPVCTLTRPSGA